VRQWTDTDCILYRWSLKTLFFQTKPLTFKLTGSW